MDYCSNAVPMGKFSYEPGFPGNIWFIPHVQSLWTSIGPPEACTFWFQPELIQATSYGEMKQLISFLARGTANVYVLKLCSICSSP